VRRYALIAVSLFCGLEIKEKNETDGYYSGMIDQFLTFLYLFLTKTSKIMV
jgi:hypothetical protein